MKFRLNHIQEHIIEMAPGRHLLILIQVIVFFMANHTKPNFRYHDCVKILNLFQNSKLLQFIKPVKC
jgi:hypothetical protein